ncbi:restriction endonuclease [Halalkalibacillus sediminis]|uniref:site-specific DNA-methyltransferase (adenine-specific) n=1 Tax=Halalkalibacillus sediminis TaxID=2018042 RepID=A0A2I0QT91_9BACI|nr:Eco57I restriction-modification methylase domain-containing protein [Halalkalibacillus sediminis]PKR77562.1 restriction endonuclease [Halalkalibacillus sediminis]
MENNIYTPRQSLNKAFLKEKPGRDEFDSFKRNFRTLLESVSVGETEEYHKNLITQFLKDTYYKNQYFINTKGRSDLVIYNGKDTSHTVGVILEVKNPSNNAEMLSKDNINVKAMHELLLYYLRERVVNRNYEIKQIIATNLNEWFIFDANIFENAFANNKELINQFMDFENQRLSGSTTQFFYQNIAKPAIKSVIDNLEFTYVNITDGLKLVNNENNEKKLITLYKLFSPTHLLKLPFSNDSNNLNKKFYTELLYIIGLSEKADNGKKIIQRMPTQKRNNGSLMENTIMQIESLDKLSRLEKPHRFGKTNEDRLFNVSLELVLNWINRVLFMKLLEGQLVNFHKGDQSYLFLNSKKVRNFDELNNLFFNVLAKGTHKRNDEVTKKFKTVPYLNSSLFEPTELEHSCFTISQLRDQTLPIYQQTILLDHKGKKRTGELDTLQYLFEFLNAYDFSSEGNEKIQEQSKTIINASVLGLIFEKINGYKDGSFFTPGYITMFISRETIRRKVVQKFNETKDWNCNNFNELFNKITDKKEANDIINSIKICDPAVGSGHFLVSALNELIAIKSDLKILIDKSGRTLRDYHLEVINDELIITNEDGILFEYHPTNRESQRIQETIFREKKSIIENCLFGVDINPNSVNICRLRLWIELLKNAYYKDNGNSTELETLPNIDINIKWGNSLVSRYPLDAPLGKITKKSKLNVSEYLKAVDDYRNATNKEEKRSLEILISEIKNNFESNVTFPDQLKLSDLEKKLFLIENQTSLFELSRKEKIERNKNIKSLKNQINSHKKKIDDIKSNKMYEESFEWRFEFPEVLDNKGKFIGFDIIIGNPPYVYRKADLTKSLKDYYKTNYFNVDGNFDLYKYFVERSVQLLAPNGYNCLITNSSFLLQQSFKKTREYILYNSTLELIAPLGPNIFKEATVDTVIYLINNNPKEKALKQVKVIPMNKTKSTSINKDSYYIDQRRFFHNENYAFDCLLNEKGHNLVHRLFNEFPPIEHGFDFGVGINTGYIKNELTDVSKVDNRYHPMVPGSGISKYGEVRTDGYIMYDKEFVKSQGKLGRALPSEKFFYEPKILIVRTRNLSLNDRIIATIDTEKKYNLNRLSNIIAKEGFNIYGLLGILNSSLFNWLFSKRYLDYEIKPIYLRKAPLANSNDSELITLVGKIMYCNKESTEYNKLKKQIDDIVFNLYNLTDEERALIKNDLNK